MAMKHHGFMLLAMLTLELASAIPTLTSEAYFNLGLPIRIQYSSTDGLDGRADQTSGNDWIGLYRSGTCLDPKNIVDRHKCFIASKAVPRDWPTSSGEITFEVGEYHEAGDFDVRYFYGDDPAIEGESSSPHFTWSGDGYVCNTAAGMQGSIFYLNEIDPAWVAYVASQTNWTASDHSTLYQPAVGCDCDPNVGDFATKRGCCLRHLNCVPQMDEAVNVCRHYHDTYLTNQDVTISCTCDPSAGSAEVQTQCLETRAACLRCALDSVTSTTVHVMSSFGLGATQKSVSALPGFELML